MRGSNIAKEIDEEYRRRKLWNKIKKKRKEIKYEEKKGEKKAL